MESIQTNDPAFADPTAVFGRRCFAFIIDLVILIVVGLITLAQVASLEELDSPDEAKYVCDAITELGDGDICANFDSTVFLIEADDSATIPLVVLAFAALNMLIISSITGGSLGKLALSIRVVDKSTFAKAGFLKHLLRWVLMIVDSFPWFMPLTGLIVGLSTRGHRRFGDFAANTLVVRKRHVGVPTLVPGVNDDAVSIMPLPGLWEPPIQPPPRQPPPRQPPLSEPIAPEPIAEQPAYAAEMAPDPSGDVDVAERAHVEQHHDPEPEPAPTVASDEQAQQPGVDAPTWDEARNTYIQWDPELEAWMEWSESGGQWIPISQ